MQGSAQEKKKKCASTQKTLKISKTLSPKTSETVNGLSQHKFPDLWDRGSMQPPFLATSLCMTVPSLMMLLLIAMKQPPSDSPELSLQLTSLIVTSHPANCPAGYKTLPHQQDIVMHWSYLSSIPPARACYRCVAGYNLVKENIERHHIFRLCPHSIHMLFFTCCCNMLWLVAKRNRWSFFSFIRAKRVSNWYIPKKKSARVHVCTCARVFD